MTVEDQDLDAAAEAAEETPVEDKVEETTEEPNEEESQRRRERKKRKEKRKLRKNRPIMLKGQDLDESLQLLKNMSKPLEAALAAKREVTTEEDVDDDMPMTRRELRNYLDREAEC